ncbi:F-box protein At4g00755-like [Dioscorea cayenensis subsp. rotundata]|uniref:F-box protein At4g00755-like n=1 Tax=Dioscorea cayennensis subsp. rotundata TaxID=55577 RepID=A0AB40B4Y3_DIOCR|nr:F-box protein At4g00755-like [Dioscorea cayenensis subsp. rotundata]XP_039122317.1 F-box protein At4g00755-like [Dioscorea cayenensis subsp. rotundata]
MGQCWDFVELLGRDLSITIFNLLDDPADLVRVSFVSRSWHRFVITNGFSKHLCLSIWPELSNFSRVVEISGSTVSANAESSSCAEWKNLEREHKVYAYLSHCIVSPMGKMDCIGEAISASSTDNYPDESIDNTLEDAERVDLRPSYWSSKGEEDPSISEMLTYKLCSKLCVIDEIRIQPFRAFFQYGYPIYSAKSVRFRMGQCRFPQKQRTLPSEHAAGRSADNYIWTYVSPVFQMAQENVLQSFKLPRPVVCVGGVVQIELMGRVQKQEMDDLYYICVCHVQIIGYPLAPVIDVDIIDPMGKLVLKYFPGARGCKIAQEVTPSEDTREPSGWNAIAARIRQLGVVRGWNQAIVSRLLGNIPEDVDDDDDDDDVVDV